MAARQGELRDQVLAAVGKLKEIQFVTRPGLRSRETNPGVAEPDNRGAWEMELNVETVRLKRAATMGSKYSLAISARVRVRTDAGDLVHDMPVAFESESSVFIDWTYNRGAPLRRVAEHGYRLMAEEIVARVFAK